MGNREFRTVAKPGHAADLLEQCALYVAEPVAEQFDMSRIVVFCAASAELEGIVTFALVTFMFVILGLLELVAARAPPRRRLEAALLAPSRSTPQRKSREDWQT